MTDLATGPTPRIERIVDELRNGIVSGKYLPETKLRAEILAVELGVSPTPIREAFQRLTAEGLVSYSSQRGVRVSAATRQELEELYELRQVLEPWALRRSMAHATPQFKRDIRAQLKELNTWYRPRKNPADLMSQEYEEVHQAFHRSLLAGCDSAWLLKITHMLSATSARYRNLANANSLRERVRDEHNNLARLVMSGDADAAATALSGHLNLTYVPVAAVLDHSAGTTGA